MIDIQGLSKQYGSKVLFEGAAARIGGRSKLALVGPNGSGKSTLIRMILGHEDPDHGRVTRVSHLAIGHLAQEVPRFADRAVIDEVLRMDGRRDELLQARRELEERLAQSSQGFEAGETDLERYGRVMEELEDLDEYRLESRAQAILEGIGFRKSDFDRKLSGFSGGWLMRVALARILLMGPDLLLLDEPTNHLDLESLLWLEDFLRNFRGAVLLVSHDTEFVNRLVDEVVEVDQRKLWTYRGNLDSYVAQKEERLRVLRSQFESQQSRIAEIEAFVRRFGAKATKARQAQSRMKELERMDRIELPDDRDRVGFRFPPATRSGKEVVTFRRAELSYGDKVVFRDLEWILQRGSRVAVVGPNGAGKTSLLKLLSGVLQASQGEVKLGHEVRVGYYAQHQAEALNYRHTILEELEATAPELPVARVRGIAGAFLFTGDAVDKKCGVLSGGEKARVALAKLLLSPSNFLILDEPTNHLDVESRGVLLEALQEYEGTLVLVSHDRAFVGPLVDTVLEIEPSPLGSRVIPLLGGYEDYLSKKLKEVAEQGARLRRDAGGPNTAVSSSTASLSAPPRRQGPSNNQRRAWEQERDRLETEISGLESEIARLDEVLGLDSTYADKQAMLRTVEERKKAQESLGQKYSRWEKVCSDLEGA